MLAALRRLKQAGYTIALDDFVVHDPRAPLIELADILKVDIRQTTIADGRAMMDKCPAGGVRLLAEKVETRDEFAAAKAAGFSPIFRDIFFAGLRYCRPKKFLPIA